MGGEVGRGRVCSIPFWGGEGVARTAVDVISWPIFGWEVVLLLHVGRELDDLLSVQHAANRKLLAGFVRKRSASG